MKRGASASREAICAREMPHGHKELGSGMSTPRMTLPKAIAKQQGQLLPQSTRPHRSGLMHSAQCSSSRASHLRQDKMLRAAALQKWRCLHATVGVRRFQAWAQSGPPSWWLKGRPRRVHGSLPEVQLLSHLAVLLKPEVPIAELFRDFPTARSPAWGARILSPSLALFCVLENTGAALFLEYDGYYRHHEESGLAADERKTEALLHFAPPGSRVLRIAHAHRGLQARNYSVEVVVERWNASRKEAVLAPVRQVVDAVLEELGDALQPLLKKELQAVACSTSRLCFTNAGNFVVGAEIGRNRELKCAQLRCFLEQLGLKQMQISRVVECFPSVLNYSIEANLKPTVEWLRDLGLSQAQLSSSLGL